MRNEKTFEELFPSLKGKEQCIVKTDGPVIQTVINKGEKMIIDEKAKIIFYDGFVKQDIQENCFDKQRVRKILKPLWELHELCRTLNYETDLDTSAELYRLRDKIYDLIKSIEKELGL